MSSLEEKLAHFNEVILNDATSERDRILLQTKSEIDSLIERKKNEFQQQADEILKKEKASAEKEKNIAISKAIIESKQLLIKAREDMVNAVFNDVRKLLEDFVRKDDYYAFLSEEIKKSSRLAGKGEMVIYLKENDLRRFSKELEALKEELPEGIYYEGVKDDIIGGCRVLNRTERLIIDNTLLKKLEVRMDMFIRTFGLKIG
ncbi:MAG: hypothetical protein HPY74_09565 [Firmicutes bacterium]|nr:hypothetical protein [Bacillota bacterium]